MNNSQVAHVWAQQTKPEGEGSNFYFCDSTIYSFGGHFPIARFTDTDIDGAQVVLFTIKNDWGGYTGRHIGHVYNALRGLNVFVIECLEPAERNGCHGSRRLSESDRHAANLDDYEARYNKALASAGKARTRGPELIEYAERMRETCGRYCEAFGLTIPQWVRDAIPADIETIRAQSAERAARASEGKRCALSGKVQEWRNGKACDISEYPDTLLRLSSNGRSVETSRGASVPVDDAKALWAIVAECQRSGRSLSGRSLNAGGSQVGNFTLRAIAADGTCTVGCHTLAYSETRAFAIAQGWAK